MQPSKDCRIGFRCLDGILLRGPTNLRGEDSRNKDGRGLEKPLALFKESDSQVRRLVGRLCVASRHSR